MIYFVMADKKVIDESHHISSRRGNGQLRREVWVNEEGQVTRYRLAYINHRLHSGDNGRVIGYDNAHGHHHRHFFGQMESVDFASFAEIEERFMQDWLTLRHEP